MTEVKRSPIERWLSTGPAPRPRIMRMEPIGGRPMTQAMENVFAGALGRIAREAGDPERKDVGDHIDRGLILRNLLEDAGFYLVRKEPE